MKTPRRRSSAWALRTKLIKEVSAACGGSGGGKPDSAMGGCKNVLKLDDALAVVDDLVNDTAKD